MMNIIQETYKRTDTTHYYPYGEPWSQPTGQPWLFGGKERERRHHLGDSDFGARTYNAARSTFAQPDPLAERYYPINPYTYCAADPINHTDPSGCKIIIYNGTIIYNDNSGDGIVYLLPSFNKSYKDKAYEIDSKIHGSTSELGSKNYIEDMDPVSGAPVDKALIKKLEKVAKEFDKSDTPISENAELQSTLLLLPVNASNIDEIVKIVEQDNGERGTFDSNNREYGGIFLSDRIDPVTGKISKPGQSASIITNPYKSSFHTHPSGTSSEAVFLQKPSQQDIDSKKTDDVSFVVGRRSGKIYFYNQNGVLGSMNWKDFIEDVEKAGQ